MCECVGIQVGQCVSLCVSVWAFKRLRREMEKRVVLDTFCDPL